jgi:small subunit ribosomal protein S16
MALKIRLRQQGRNNRPTYRLVVTDSRNPRDGKYVEMVGWYNPFETELEQTLSVKPDRIQYWIGVGAQLTHSAQSLIAKVAPGLLKNQTEKQLALRAKMATKRKAHKEATA